MQLVRSLFPKRRRSDPGSGNATLKDAAPKKRAAYQSGPSLGEEFDTEEANSVPSKSSERPPSGLRPPFVHSRPALNSGVAVCLLRSKR
jgi:hypothetical protein